MLSANIVSIQRLCTHDGPGIRTVVFLKGCPLNCLWCQNPESLESRRELLFNHSLCRFCGNCARVCPNQAHCVTGHEHYLDRAKCRQCFRCVTTCTAGALEVVGQEMTVEDVLREVTQDNVFYKTSGGGVTISGGEPVANADFVFALLTALRAEGIHTCVETCGYGAKEDFLNLSRFVDLFLWDVKSTNDKDHLRYTGVRWQPILDNLLAVDAGGAKTILRCPLLAEIHMTRDHLDSIADLAVRLQNCLGVQLLPYHAFGTVKAEHLGKNQVVYGTPDRESVRDAREYVTGRIAEHNSRMRHRSHAACED